VCDRTLKRVEGEEKRRGKGGIEDEEEGEVIRKETRPNTKRWRKETRKGR
jgi:hypothetical protein